MLKELTHGSRLEAGEVHEGGIAASRRPEGDNDGLGSLGDTDGVAGVTSPLLMEGDASPFIESPVLSRARPMGKGAGFTDEFAVGAAGRAPVRTGVNN
jgi:hypothetical protein